MLQPWEKKKKEGAETVSVFERRQQEARAEAAKVAPIGTSQLSSVPKEASPPQTFTSSVGLGGVNPRAG